MVDADKTPDTPTSPLPRDAADAPPKPSKAEIPSELEETCDRYGEGVIGMMLAMGFTPGPDELQDIYYSKEKVEQARVWLTNRSRSRQRRERITFALEILVVLLILGEILLSLWDGHLQSQDFDKQQQVLTNLQNSSAATAKTLTSLQSATESMNTILQMQLDAARKSEAQAERSAKAGEASASTASQAMHVSERAYIYMTASLTKPPTAGESFQISVVIGNSGRTPALEVGVQHRAALVPISIHVNEARAMASANILPNQHNSRANLPPGQTMQAQSDSPHPLTQFDIDQIAEGKELIYLFAEASYKDIFEQPHSTETCGIYDPKLKVTINCEERNKSD
jgi:hypothetical protein